MKRAPDRFPARSIAYCLKEAGLRLHQVDTVATAWDHHKYPGHMNDFMKSIRGRELDAHADLAESLVHTKLAADLAELAMRIGMIKIDPVADCKILFLPHHLCHAASVHYLSAFEQSSILAMDGSGEEIATSTWRGDGDDISLIEQRTLPDLLGWFYAAMTEYLGFDAYSGEGKVMGLAPYGEPDRAIADKLRQFCIPDTEKGYRVDPTFVFYGPRTYSRRFTDKLADLLGPPRVAESELTDRHTSVAFETQKLLEEISSALARDLISKTGYRSLCITGGVAMNCKMNGVLSNLEEVDRVFINPASHDSDTAIGAALIAAMRNGILPRKNALTHAFWGPQFSDHEIEQVLAHCHLPYRQGGDVADEAASMLVEGKIIGWFHGRAEFGARALGARSILANPLLQDVKDRVNARVKYREPFRPFAPSLIEEARDRYMVNAKDSPFMLLAYEFKQEFKKLFPGVVHVDGSVRPQTVSRDTNPAYWELIAAFGQKTGHPVVLNTSFNIRGEPIVNTPLEAIRCFYSTGMDALVIGPYILEKQAGVARR